MLLCCMLSLCRLSYAVINVFGGDLPYFEGVFFWRADDGQILDFGIVVLIVAYFIVSTSINFYPTVFSPLWTVIVPILHLCHVECYIQMSQETGLCKPSAGSQCECKCWQC